MWSERESLAPTQYSDLGKGMNEGICLAQIKQLTDEEFSHRTAKKQKNEDREKYERVEGSDSLSEASKQTQKDKVWMALGLLPPIPHIDRLCSQEAASSQWMEKEDGILWDMFTHSAVPCWIPLCTSQQGAWNGCCTLWYPCFMHCWVGGL